MEMEELERNGETTDGALQNEYVENGKKIAERGEREESV